VPDAIQSQHWQGIEDAVHRCIIHNTLLHPPNIHVGVGNPVSA